MESWASGMQYVCVYAYEGNGRWCYEWWFGSAGADGDHRCCSALRCHCIEFFIDGSFNSLKTKIDFERSLRWRRRRRCHHRFAFFSLSLLLPFHFVRALEFNGYFNKSKIYGYCTFSLGFLLGIRLRLAFRMTWFAQTTIITSNWWFEALGSGQSHSRGHFCTHFSHRIVCTNGMKRFRWFIESVLFLVIYKYEKYQMMIRQMKAQEYLKFHQI